MEIVRLLTSDDSWDKFEKEWANQCEEVGDAFDSYGAGPVSVTRQLAQNGSQTEWAIALFDAKNNRSVACACAILATQKGYTGKVLRIREVIVCPLLDYGSLPETEYVDTLIGLLNGAVKLSESSLKAKHIKLHLRSPSDAIFFRAVGKSLDSQGVFAATESHGAWLSFTKQSSAPLRAV